MVSNELPKLRTSVSVVRSYVNIVVLYECFKVEDQLLKPEEYVHIIKVCTFSVFKLLLYMKFSINY